MRAAGQRRRARRARRRPPRRPGGAGRRHRQPHDPAGRQSRVMRQLPRRSGWARMRLPCDRRGGGWSHRRAAHRPPARREPLAGPAAIPRRGSRRWLGAHDRPLHPGGDGRREPQACGAGLGRFAAHERHAGGPRLDGLERRAQAPGRAEQPRRHPRRRARRLNEGAGAPPAARARRGHRRGARGGARGGAGLRRRPLARARAGGGEGACAVRCRSRRRRVSRWSTAMSEARAIHAPRGTGLSCRGWQQEAAMRMLMNNLDPEVAERPDDLVVYGGTGRAARSWEAFDAIVRTLQGLEHDETLLVQSGKPVGVFRTHEWAPRVLIANSNLVPDWATWEEFRRLEDLGLTMYGQMTAGSWVYIGTQGIVQGTYECFAEIARRRFDGSLAGTVTVTAGLGGMGGAQPLAITMNGGAALCIEVDPERIRRRIETRYLDEVADSLVDAIARSERARSEGRAGAGEHGGALSGDGRFPGQGRRGLRLRQQPAHGGPPRRVRASVRLPRFPAGLHQTAVLRGQGPVPVGGAVRGSR